MIYSLKISNFRSIKSQEIMLAPVTVMYGPNGAGKSSLLYSLFTLRNVVLNPNQSSAAFFNLNFANLGDFKGVIFDHRNENSVGLGIEIEKNSSKLSYKVSIGEKGGEFALDAGGEFKIKLRLASSFPYPANQQDQKTLEVEGKTLEILWNGITAQVNPTEQTPETQEKAREIATVLNTPAEALRKIDFVPLRRGFSKPYYSPVAMPPTLLSEDEVATFLSGNKYVEGKVSTYLERITRREFRVHWQTGTAIFSLDTVEKPLGMVSELVNDGFGINQLVYFLTKSLRQDVDLVCVEEPEIHLHPTAIRELARALAQMVKNEGKTFLISSHSEQFLFALLSLVAEEELKPQDLACYLTVKKGKETHFELQEVQDNGQIKGGLSSFMEGEFKDIKAFLKVKD